ncbi:hypothetical protein bpuCAU1_001289 (plasmid) [Borrelia puertoricensis]|uniref:BTA121 domain-containing protein surface lipoprotein n=1 Tax=Borrelia puertoricensis TaxID=2756107 RepID=UPI003EB7EF86
MLKIRHIILFLVLILLFISCDLKSQRKGLGQEDSDFSEIFTGERTLRKFGKGVNLTGVNSVVEQRQFSEVVDLTDLEENVPKLTEEEKSLHVKLNNLLDTFGVSLKEREAVGYILSVVTDANIGINKGYKTYTSLEFCNLLNELGAVKLKKIIECHLKVLEEQEKARNAILNAPLSFNKQELRDSFNKHKDNYKFYLKGLFNRAIADDIYNNIIIDDYDVEFNKIKQRAEGLIEVGYVYAQLSDEEKSVIDGMQIIVTDDSIARGKGYKSYDNFLFDFFLDNMGILKVREMIIAHLNNLKAQDEASSQAKVVIESVGTPQIRKGFKSLFDSYKRGYQEHLKSLFNSDDPDEVYKRVVKDLYAGNFTTLNSRANFIIRYEKFYEEFSDSRKNAINDIRKILTDSKIHSDKQVYKLYRGFDFELLLGRLGAAKVGEIMDLHLRIKEAEEGIKNALENAKESPVKEWIRGLFNSEVNRYLLFVKYAFDNPFFDPDRVCSKFANNNFVDRYSGIQNLAMQRLK